MAETEEFSINVYLKLHGKWVRDDHQEIDFDGSYTKVISYKCSHCNRNTDWTPTNFCGNCGAKMDLES